MGVAFHKAAVQLLHGDGGLSPAAAAAVRAGVAGADLAASLRVAKAGWTAMAAAGAAAAAGVLAAARAAEVAAAVAAGVVPPAEFRATDAIWAASQKARRSAIRRRADGDVGAAPPVAPPGYVSARVGGHRDPAAVGGRAFFILLCAEFEDLGITQAASLESDLRIRAHVAEGRLSWVLARGLVGGRLAPATVHFALDATLGARLFVSLALRSGAADTAGIEAVKRAHSQLLGVSLGLVTFDAGRGQDRGAVAVNAGAGYEAMCAELGVLPLAFRAMIAACGLYIRAALGFTAGVIRSVADEELARFESDSPAAVAARAECDRVAAAWQRAFTSSRVVDRSTTGGPVVSHPSWYMLHRACLQWLGMDMARLSLAARRPPSPAAEGGDPVPRGEHDVRTLRAEVRRLITGTAVQYLVGRALRSATKRGARPAAVWSVWMGLLDPRNTFTPQGRRRDAATPGLQQVASQRDARSIAARAVRLRTRATDLAAEAAEPGAPQQTRARAWATAASAARAEFASAQSEKLLAKLAEAPARAGFVLATSMRVAVSGLYSAEDYDGQLEQRWPAAAVAATMAQRLRAAATAIGSPLAVNAATEAESRALRLSGRACGFCDKRVPADSFADLRWHQAFECAGGQDARRTWRTAFRAALALPVLSAAPGAPEAERAAAAASAAAAAAEAARVTAFWDAPDAVYTGTLSNLMTAWAAADPRAPRPPAPGSRLHPLRPDWDFRPRQGDIILALGLGGWQQFGAPDAPLFAAISAQTSRRLQLAYARFLEAHVLQRRRFKERLLREGAWVRQALAALDAPPHGAPPQGAPPPGAAQGAVPPGAGAPAGAGAQLDPAAILAAAIAAGQGEGKGDAGDDDADADDDDADSDGNMAYDHAAPALRPRPLARGEEEPPSSGEEDSDDDDLNDDDDECCGAGRPGRK